MQSVVKGMVQVAGRTYRIVRLSPGHYSVVRILDDRRVGAFNCPTNEVLADGIEPVLMREIVREAVQGGKTSWVRRLIPG